MSVRAGGVRLGEEVGFEVGALDIAGGHHDHTGRTAARAYLRTVLLHDGLGGDFRGGIALVAWRDRRSVRRHRTNLHKGAEVRRLPVDDRDKVEDSDDVGRKDVGPGFGMVGSYGGEEADAHAVHDNVNDVGAAELLDGGVQGRVVANVEGQRIDVWCHGGVAPARDRGDRGRVWAHTPNKGSTDS